MGALHWRSIRAEYRPGYGNEPAVIAVPINMEREDKEVWIVHEVAHLLLDHGPHLHAAEEIPRGKDEPEELVINVDDPSDPRGVATDGTNSRSEPS